MSNTTPSTASTPKAPKPAPPAKPQSPATPAAQTTVIPTVAPAPAAQPAPTPVPKPKRKLPRWIWSVVALIGGFCLGLAFPQFMIAIVSAITFWSSAPAIVSWIQVQNEKKRQKAEEEQRAAVAAATAAGQPITQTAKAPKGPSWQALLGGLVGLLGGIVMAVILNWAIVMFTPGVAGQAYLLPSANVAIMMLMAWIGYGIGNEKGRK